MSPYYTKNLFITAVQKRKQYDDQSGKHGAIFLMNEILQFTKEEPVCFLSKSCQPFPKRQIEDFADTNFKLQQNGRKFSKWIENTGKRRNCSLRAISPFPTVFSRVLYCRHVKKKSLFWKGLKRCLNPFAKSIDLYQATESAKWWTGRPFFIFVKFSYNQRISLLTQLFEEKNGLIYTMPENVTTIIRYGSAERA